MSKIDKKKYFVFRVLLHYFSHALKVAYFKGFRISQSEMPNNEFAVAMNCHSVGWKTALW